MDSQSVVDQMTSTLAERRRLARDRRAAYVALARAILSDDPGQQPGLYAVDSRQTELFRQRRAAAA
ncbi:MAG: hypothetical protein M3336_03495 [Chloroflexota bacterium]|nr:hypothetical protein [Chloroflexota bacterium]